MAQYRLSVAIVSRSEGQSVVAAAAYRAGSKLQDERTGEIKDFSRRSWSVLYTRILTPENAPAWMRHRQGLWNGVEFREDRSTRRGTAQLARDIEPSLPHELTHEQHVELVCEFVKDEFVDRGMVADIAIHAPPYRGNGTNHHAHILLTMRHIEDGGFGPKNRDWNEDALLEHWRERWGEYENRALEKYGHEARVDHRSLKDQGIDREPTTHLGPNAQAMEDKGIRTDRGDLNRRIKSNNDNLKLAKKDLADCEKRLAALRQRSAAERMERIQKTVRAVRGIREKPEERQAPTQERPSEPPDRPPRPSTSERMKQIEKTVRHADKIWKEAEARRPTDPEPPPEPEPPSPSPPLQPKDAPYYPAGTPPPVPAGGKAAPMPDDLSKQQDLAAQQEADKQKHAQDEEKAHQDKASKDEADRLQQLRDAETKRVEDSAKQNADRLAAQAEQMRQDHARIQADQARRAQLDAYNAEMAKRAEEARRKEEAERQAKLEDKAKEGPIREASSRYAQALGQNYDIRDPYASLAKSAMAEYAAFRRDREAYDQQIAKSADPQERQRLDLRKRIEGADYLALTGDRIAAQSEIITGRLNSQEAVKERQKATDYRIQAQDLRQQLRELHQDRTPEKEREPERSQPIPEPTRPSRSRSRGANKLDDLIKQQDEKTKAKQQEQEKDPERQKELERERELRRKRDRDR